MIDRIKNRSKSTVELFAPAKVNLFLAVTGKREDGYHDLCTVLAKVSVGDTLEMNRTDKNEGVNLRCPGFEDLETSGNLISQAVDKWFQQSGESWGVEITLKKKIPPMSGLGGGSSDAVSALLGMNELGDESLPADMLYNIASEIGSDCPSFLTAGLCLAEGRGEHVRSIIESLSQQISGQRVLLFRPDIGFSTADVYAKLASKKSYSAKKRALEVVKSWENGNLLIEELLHNDLEIPVFEKHRYFLPLFEQIKQQYGIQSRLSGSGSCCFALLPSGFDQISQLKDLILKAWGDKVFLQTCEIID
jgi:4-diphosphocytidyl-2-C-methyl-D-erythritol kinase